MSKGDQVSGSNGGAQSGSENLRLNESDDAEQSRSSNIPNPLNLSDQRQLAQKRNIGNESEETIEATPAAVVSRPPKAFESQVLTGDKGSSPPVVNRDGVPPTAVVRTPPIAEKPHETAIKGIHQQSVEAMPSNAKVTPSRCRIDKRNCPYTGGDVNVKGNQPTVANSNEHAPVRNVTTEVKGNEGGRPVTDATGGIKSIGAQNVEAQAQAQAQVPQSKNVVSNPADRPQLAGDVSPDRKIEGPGVTQNATPRVNETSPSPVLSAKGVVESPNPSCLKSCDYSRLIDRWLVTLPQHCQETRTRVNPARIDQPNVAAAKFEPPKGSDVISTQGSPIQTNRPDIAKSVESKVETGRPAEQAGIKDAAPIRDPKAAGVLNETFGQKTDAGSRVESSAQPGGNKQDAVSAGQKADQITKGIEGRVNEGAKQPNTTDGASSGGRQPGIEGGGKSQGIADGAQPGVKQTGATDGAGVTGRQPNVADGTSSIVPQPLHEAGDKAPTSGGGGSASAESTKKIDASMGGGKSEGQTASGGMGGGSSAPADRAPHKPFSVEDGQPTKGATGSEAAGGKAGDAVGGKGGDIAGTKGGEAAGGKAGDVVGGKGGDIAGAKGSSAAGTGPRFDTGEVRGTEPGARFDSGENEGWTLRRYAARRSKRRRWLFRERT